MMGKAIFSLLSANPPAGHTKPKQPRK
ncbi:MAG: hypothetical protein QG596_2123, partial [Actinomycetota bacterium]|nr:hypothetical protein [Actinomycetota bacterium]